MDAYLRALAHFRNWTYGNLNRAEARIECCALTALVIEQALKFAKDSAWWDDMMIMDAERPWSPVTGTAKRLRAEAVLPSTGPNWPPADRWLLIQGWRKNGTGHQVLWLAHRSDPWQGWVYESSSYKGMGPCVRGLRGRVPLAEAIDHRGEPLQAIEPLDFGELVNDFDAGLAWVELPEAP